MLNEILFEKSKQPPYENANSGPGYDYPVLGMIYRSNEIPSWYDPVSAGDQSWTHRAISIEQPE